MAYRSRSNGGTRKVVRKESHNKNNPPAPASVLAVMWSHKLVAGPHQLLKTPLLHIHSPVDLDVWVGIHDHPAVSGCVLGTRVNEGRHVNAHVGTNSGIVRAIIKSA